MRNSPLRSDSGASLPEVCVAAGLVATAAVTLTALFALAAEANRTAGDLMHAAMLARQTLEALRRPAGAALPPSGDDVVDRTGAPPAAASIVFGATYQRRWQTEAFPAGTTLIEVEVTSTPAGRRQPIRVRLAGLARVSP
jgi:Tfp pilus assembly protein PilV